MKKTDIDRERLRLSTKSKKKSLITFFGKWPGSNEELTKIKKNIEQERKRFKTRSSEDKL